MPNPLFNKFGNTNNSYQSQNIGGNNFLNVLNQYRQIQNNPGKILDILIQNGKINQQQYNELQAYRNNPQEIVNYLSRQGNNANSLNQIIQSISNINI